MTQEELDNKVGVTVQAVSQWEHKRNKPDIDTIPIIAKALNITVAELLGDTERPFWIVKDKLFSEEHMFTRLKITAEADDLSLLKQALYYAREKHRGQFRKLSMFSDEQMWRLVNGALD